MPQRPTPPPPPGEADRTARLELAEASRRRLRFELHAASAVLANFLGGGAPFHRRLARPLARGPAADAIADGALGDGALRPLGGAAPGGVLRPLGGDSLAAMQQRAAALRPGGGGSAWEARGGAASGDSGGGRHWRSGHHKGEGRLEFRSDTGVPGSAFSWCRGAHPCAGPLLRWTGQCGGVVTWVLIALWVCGGAAGEWTPGRGSGQGYPARGGLARLLPTKR